MLLENKHISIPLVSRGWKKNKTTAPYICRGLLDVTKRPNQATKMTNAFSKPIASTTTAFEALFTPESIERRKTIRKFAIQTSADFTDKHDINNAAKSINDVVNSWVSDDIEAFDDYFKVVNRNQTLAEAIKYTTDFRLIALQMLYARSIYYTEENTNEARGKNLCEFWAILKDSGYEISSVVKVIKNEKPPKIVNGELDPTHVYDELNTLVGIYTPDELVEKEKLDAEHWATIQKRAEIQQRIDEAKTEQEKFQEFVKECADAIDKNIVDGKLTNVVVSIDEKNQTVSVSATALPKAPKPMKTCFCGCGQQAVKMQRPASKCGARYVNAEHQLNAWKEHKANCETCFLYSQNEKAKKAERNLD